MKFYPYIVVILGVFLIPVSLFFESLKGPDQWLIEWTDWAAKYVALAVAAYSIVKLANGAETFLNNWKPGNDN